MHGEGVLVVGEAREDGDAGVALGLYERQQSARRAEDRLGREVLLRDGHAPVVPAITDLDERRAQHAVDHRGGLAETGRAIEAALQQPWVEALDRLDDLPLQRAERVFGLGGSAGRSAGLGFLEHEPRGLGGGHAFFAQLPYATDHLDVGLGVDAVRRVGAAGDRHAVATLPCAQRRGRDAGHLGHGLDAVLAPALAHVDAPRRADRRDCCRTRMASMMAGLSLVKG